MRTEKAQAFAPEPSPLASCPHIRAGNASSHETLSLEHAIVSRERVGKLIDHDSDRIVAAVDAPSCFLHQQRHRPDRARLCRADSSK
jgi:hypothetical protein